VKIFISYRSTNRRAVEELVSDLKDVGHEVWYDRELEGGQKWWDNVLANIQRCDLLVFALTPQSIESYPCRLEYTYANALKKHIIPIALTDGMDFTLLPPVLQERQILTYVTGDKAEYKELTQALRTLPPVPPLPDPLPEPPPAPISPLAPIKAQIDSPKLEYEQQVAIVHQLKSYVHDPAYTGTARELLVRLDQHPMLLASVHRDIEALLVAAPAPQPPPTPVSKPMPAQAPAGETAMSKAEAVEESAPVLREGERVVAEKDASVHTGSWGLWQASTLRVTNQRLVFEPRGLSTLYGDVIEILLSDITEINKVLKALNPAIQIRTKTQQEYYVTLGKTGLGNRDKLIDLIQQFR